MGRQQQDEVQRITCTREQKQTDFYRPHEEDIKNDCYKELVKNTVRYNKELMDKVRNARTEVDAEL